jgi:hypothetical protein
MLKPCILPDLSSLANNSRQASYVYVGLQRVVTGWLLSIADIALAPWYERFLSVGKTYRGLEVDATHATMLVT